MSYSLEKLPNAPYEIPPPPPFAVWVRETEWDHRTRTRKVTMPPVGQIRHVPDLAKAKERVRRYCIPGRYQNGDSKEFDADWAVYLWDADKKEYALQYEGAAGETVRMNEFMAEKITKGQRVPRAGLDDEVEAALASIANAVR